MARIEYGGWNPKTHRLDTVLTPAEAQTRYESGNPRKWFTVVAFGDDVSTAGIPDFTMQVVPSPNGATQYVSPSFYDEHFRRRFAYGFQRIDDLMFLQTVWSRTYDAAHGDDPVRLEERVFSPDGMMHWRSNDKVARVVEEFDAPADVSNHWEAVPAFGEWERIARFER